MQFTEVALSETPRSLNYCWWNQINSALVVWRESVNSHTLQSGSLFIIAKQSGGNRLQPFVGKKTSCLPMHLDKIWHLLFAREANICYSILLLFSVFCFPPAQVLRYFDYVFTGVFTFEMIIKVGGEHPSLTQSVIRGAPARLGGPVWRPNE